MSHQHLYCPPNIYPNQNIHVKKSERNEEGTSSSYHTENEYSKKSSVRLSAQNETLDRQSNKLVHQNLFTAPQISIIDLLGDGGTNKNPEEISGHAHEDHVAFSIEGLGKVETVTPVHSPERPGKRSILNGYPLPRKSRRQDTTNRMYNGFDDLEPLEDVMMQDVDFPPYDSLKDQSFDSRGLTSTVTNTNQGFLSCRQSSPFNWSSNMSDGAFDNDDLCFSTRGSGRNIWSVGPGFSEESIGELREYDQFGKNWAASSDDDFESWNLHNKRSHKTSTKRTMNFDMTEPHVPYLEHVISKNLDFKVTDKSWFSTCQIDDDVKSDDHFVDDMKDSMSLLSEESCSSSAVRVDAKKTS